MNVYHSKMFKLFSSMSFFICGVLLLNSCGGDKITVRTEQRNIAFDLYKTYRWYEKSGFDKKGTISEITYEYIQQSIDKELKAKELSKVASGAVDFYVNVTVTAKARINIENYQVYTEIGQGYSYNRHAGFYPTRLTETHTKTTEYRDGSLVVDVIDSFSDKLVWRGVAKKRLPKDEETSHLKRKQLIEQAVSVVLADFPPVKK